MAGVERNKNVFKNNLKEKTIIESKNINLSLSTLLRCFRNLKNNKFLPIR